jgi:hypothetical protein
MENNSGRGSTQMNADKKAGSMKQEAARSDRRSKKQEVRSNPSGFLLPLTSGFFLLASGF